MNKCLLRGNPTTITQLNIVGPGMTEEGTCFLRITVGELKPKNYLKHNSNKTTTTTTTTTTAIASIATITKNKK